MVTNDVYVFLLSTNSFPAEFTWSAKLSASIVIFGCVARADTNEAALLESSCCGDAYLSTLTHWICDSE